MISVIIPTLQKNINVLNKLIEELEADDVVGEILLIDNSLKGFPDRSDKVTVLSPQTNLFVNPSWNYGISNAKYDYFALLNDDLLLPQNFCKQIYNFLKDERVGLVGLNTECVKSKTEEDFNEYPPDCKISFSPIGNEMFLNYWGAAIFGKKENFYPIPEKLKIWCGDNYLLKCNCDHKKLNFQTEGMIIKHLGSLSCNEKRFDKFKSRDLKNYARIDERFKEFKYRKDVTFAEQIFSLKNTKNKSHKVLRILGFKIKFRRKQCATK